MNEIFEGVIEELTKMEKNPPRESLIEDEEEPIIKQIQEEVPEEVQEEIQED